MRMRLTDGDVGSVACRIYPDKSVFLHEMTAATWPLGSIADTVRAEFVPAEGIKNRRPPETGGRRGAKEVLGKMER